ncbi:chemotaxis protein CheW [Novispirillum sp. DQ9]|uniref:chemotaxis protein CheW n=1 Tax=Novispirillum sp. DQ9 TaxID=3398612 RepID=UPI003C7EA187
MSDLTTASQGQLAPVGHRAIAAQEEQVFVTVYVEKQLFGIPVERVQDILIPEKIARIPLAPPEVAGSINLRGRIVTVIDVRTRLGLRKKPQPVGKDGAEIKTTKGKSGKGNVMCVTVEQGSELYSLMVDSVGNVLNLAVKSIEPNPSTLDPRWRGISAGVVRLEGELLIVLDVDSFLNFGDQMMPAGGSRN